MVKIIQNIMLSSLLFGQTTQQIKQAKSIIENTGLSEIQVKEIAGKQGYSKEQVESAIRKEKKSKSESINNNNYDGINESGKIESVEILNSNNQIQENGQSDSNENLMIENLDSEIIDQSTLSSLKYQPNIKEIDKYFGYDIFDRDPKIFQSTSVGTVDLNYLIGPGDEIIVMLWGETQFREVQLVDREGFVFISEIGQVFVNGLNLKLLESKLFRLFSQTYASLNPQGRKPTTFLDVSLGKLRPLRIQVLGEVAQPGAYTVSPSTTLFSALYYFNGPTKLGSLRDVHLVRGDKKIASIDFYDYLLTGKKPKDQKLQLDDVVFIPPRLKTVTINGEVNRPGIYEVKENEDLLDLIKIAGGLKISAYSNHSQIDRIVPFDNREKLGMDRMILDVDLDEILKGKGGFFIEEGDKIKIESILDQRQNKVDLYGSVTRPGGYEIDSTLKISELIEKANGLLGDAYLKRADIIRISSDLKEELIKINLVKALEDDPEHNIELQGFDKVQIYGKNEMIPKKSVRINGYVKRPGLYSLKENMTLYDLIFISGGFVDQEWKSRSYLERADLIRFDNDRINQNIISFNLGKILNNPDSKDNIFLKPDDEIRVYKKDIFISNKPVTINGAVRNAATYKLKINMSLMDLILEAGGLINDVYNCRIEIARINPQNNSLDKYADMLIISSNSDFEILNYSKNISKVGSFQTLSDIKLKPYDLISIRQDPYFKNQKKVTLFGEVLYPGQYTILTSDEKITDIINRAGGLLPTAYLEASIFKREGEAINFSLNKILKNPKSSFNFNVNDNDELIINPYSNLVAIEGEVNRTGAHKYLPNKRLRYYLKQSGGFTPDADKTNIWVEYPNGDSKEFNRWSLFSPKIIDGSLIKVGKVKEREPLNITEYAKELTAILANLAQTITVLYIAFTPR